MRFSFHVPALLFLFWGQVKVQSQHPYPDDVTSHTIQEVTPRGETAAAKDLIMAACTWIGSVYLFIQSDRVSLADQYAKQKTMLYKELRSAMSELTGGCTRSIEILKIHTSDKQLILCLKFCGQESCQSFLKDYKEQKVQSHVLHKLENCLALELHPIVMELKTDGGKLDSVLENEELCLKRISEMKPSFQKDDEFAEMDKNFNNLTLGQLSHEGESSPSEISSQYSLPQSLHSCGSSLNESSTFHFQGEEFADKPLTTAHIHLFAKSVGKGWKPVGRSLGKTCRALHDTAIENLAYEFDREGRYEQAYQLLCLFRNSEGKKATVQRLVQALEENALNGIAHDLLSLNENGL